MGNTASPTSAPTEEVTPLAHRQMVGVSNGYIVRQTFNDAACSPNQFKGLSVYALGQCIPFEEKSFQLTNYLKDSAAGSPGYSVDFTLFTDKACTTVEASHQKKHPNGCESSEIYTYTTDMKLAYSDSYFSFSLPEAEKTSLRA